jgi:hypothetical protein
MSVDGEEIAGWIIPVAVVCGVLLLIMCIAFIVFAYKKGQQSALSSGGGTVEMVTARPQATAPSAAQGSTPTTAASEYSAYGIGGIDAQNESVSSGGEAYGVLPSSDGDGPRAYGILPGTSDDGYVPLRT